MSTISDEQRAAIAAKVQGMYIPSGIGDEENACTVAAINLALTGQLTDDIPMCMSKVLGRFVIRIQDELPDELRNSARYKKLIPHMAGTGREQEAARLKIITDWLLATVLPTLQPIADRSGLGPQRAAMLTEKDARTTNAAVYAAVYAVYAAAAAAGAAAADAAVYAANFWQTTGIMDLLTRLVFLEEAV